jgi:WD40 repeat protein
VIRALALALALALGAPPAPARAAIESGQGNRGSWELVWRYDEANGERNHFASVRDQGQFFPIVWREFDDTRGHRLQFYDDRGERSSTVLLARGERALAAENGEAWIVVAPDSASTQRKRIRYYRAGDAKPAWEASSGGEPLMLSPDGEALVIGTRMEEHDRFLRVYDSSSGEIRILGSDGTLRGDLPILPPFSRPAGDGRKLAFLHDGELFLLGTNGRLDWKRDVPVDNLLPRGGLSHLATGGDLVAVCGTGKEANPRGLSGTLHPEREEHLVVYDLAGRVVWQLDQEEDSPELRFHYSCALSPDGSVLATLQDTERDGIVSIYDAATGEPIAEHRAPRLTGSRTLSVAIGGETTAIVFGDLRTGVTAWNREGKLVFDGMLPFRCHRATVHSGGLLVAEHWIVRLVPEKT